jgi:hypothetical protein
MAWWVRIIWFIVQSLQPQLEGSWQATAGGSFRAQLLTAAAE